jgi:uncharacterized membrane protein YdjX (TVP38/TMEM64 family)
MTETATRAAAPLARFRLAGRLLVAMLLVSGAIVVTLNRGALDPAALEAAIAHYPAAPLVFLLLHVAASLLFIPRTVLGVVAGLLFGLWWGLLWAVLGSVLGSLAGFLVARYLNAGLIDLESMPRLGALLLKAERGGWRSVTMLRLIPVIPHSLANYALGLTRLSLADYTIGSLLGQLPMTIAYVDFGAAGERMMSGHAGWIAPTLIGLAALGLSVLLQKLWARG